MKIKTLFFLLLLTFSNVSMTTELGEIDINQLMAFQKDRNALVIDIRTAQEWNETGTIPESSKLEFFDSQGRFDADMWLDKLNQLKKTTDQPIVLVCRSGNRSGMVGNFLTQKLGMNEVYHLKNGIMPWIEAGNLVTKECPDQLACK